MSQMTGRKQLEVLREEHTSNRWCVSLRDDVFKNFMSQGNPTVQKVFGDGSLFSPFLFGKFFDPSDAFPLWEFESEVLLSNLRSSGQTTVDWFQTEQDYVLKAELPGNGKNCNVQIYADSEKVVEISGQWKQQTRESKMEWRSGNWWEYGFVRRLEMPEDADCRRIEAYVTTDMVFEIKIAKKTLGSDHPNKGKDVSIATKNSEAV
ncbi:21.7 kDa class VI heat shock protein isoform X1 [Ziziphus jujuba]|uniref:21.7 kDa class VI heat shock protein isoform X1 n=1 Tax=Ziziphus jujuba TaxID=326968 RepID=A0A6P4BG76_ZIZJJ|nr:21.7 kDa class VI heat shock protein isoform X1 [Ziziphus jujuba]